MGRSILSNGAGLVIAGVVSFLMAPLLIHRLGATFFGAWILATALLDYSGLLDTGMRQALFRFVARWSGAGERKALDRTLTNALLLSAASAGLLLLALPALAVWVPGYFITASSASGAAVREFRITLVLIGLSLAVLFPARVLGSYMSGVRRFDLYNLGTISALLARNGLIAILLLRGHGIVALAAATLAGSLFSLVCNAGLIRRADPGLSFSLKLASWTGMKELLAYGFYSFGALCGESLRSYTDALVIARTLVVALITPFNIATRLVEYLKSLTSAAAAPLMGRMSEMEGRGETARLRPVLLQSTRYFALGSFFAGALFWLDGKSFITLWVGPEFGSSYPLLLTLMAGYVFLCAQSPSIQLLFALARHRFLAWLNLAEGGANLALSIYWAHRYGLLGVALGTTVPLLFANVIVQPLYVLSLTGIGYMRYLRDGFSRPALVTGLFLLFARWLPAGEGSWSRLLLAGTAQTALFAGCAFALGLEGWERRRLLQTGRGVWRLRATT